MFTVKADTQPVTDAIMDRLPIAFARERVVALEQIADGIIASIRSRKIFDKETVGTLKKGLWRGEVKSTKSDASVDMGWSGVGAAFGPGHEFGFKKASWPIKPVGVRVSTKETSKRLGQPIVALRFVSGGLVCYSRGHSVSAPRALKPHYKPALDAYPVEQRMGEALDRAVKRAGL